MIRNARALMTRNAVIGVYGALLLVLAVTTFWPAPVPDASPWPILAVKLLPLLVFASGVLRGHNRTLIWMSFVVLVYFTLAVMEAWVRHGDWPHVTVVVLSLLLFVLALCHIRLNRQ